MTLCACCYTHAQELVVKSFEYKALDLTARSNVRYDANGIPCALLIVQSTVKDLQFRGAIIGEIKHDLNEYYIYLPEGTKHIKILSQDYMPLECAFVELNNAVKYLERKSVYQMAILPNVISTSSDNRSALSYLYDMGAEAEKNYISASNGDVESQYLLGQKFYSGEDVTQNLDKAFYWYNKASEKGYARAQCALGSMYFLGEGVPLDNNKAIYWYQKAAKNNDPMANLILGRMFLNGNGVAIDYYKSFQYLSKAQELGNKDAAKELNNDKFVVIKLEDSFNKGNTEAAYRIGQIFYNGENMKKDYQKAFLYYCKAADYGHSKAQCAVGSMYYLGEGVSLNYEKAAYWYEKAAQNNSSMACLILGRMYKNGTGVKEDSTKARYYLSKARELGNKDAEKELKNL